MLQNFVFLIMNKGSREWVNINKQAWGKSLWPSFPNTNNPTYCANPSWYAWTLEADLELGRQQPAVILCPSSFTKKNLHDEDIPDDLDTSTQPDGKVLDQMEPRFLTFYHELFHLAFDPGTYAPDESMSDCSLRILDPDTNVERSPDPNYWQSKKNNKGQPVAQYVAVGVQHHRMRMLTNSRWPAQKAGFKDTGFNIHGAVEAMYISLFDAATPAETKLDDFRSTKSPESYAWFAVANYLSTVGIGRQDWSTGACREEGADVMTVTVTRGDKVPKRTVGLAGPTIVVDGTTFTA
jgi:hypothetical protein